MRRKLKKLRNYLILIICLLTVAFFALRGKYRYVIQDLARTSVINATSDLTNDAISRQIENGTIQPFIASMVILAFTSKKSRAPKAEGIPYDKGSR